MGPNELYELFSKYGFAGIAAFIIAILFLSFAKSSWLSNQWGKLIEWTISKFGKKRAQRTVDESDILNHDIFNYIDFWTNSKIPTFEFSSDYRTFVFRKYLTIYLKTYRSELMELIQKKDFEKWDDSELWKNFLNLINTIIYKYEKDMMDQGIPKIIIEKMKVRNNDTITLVIDLIQDICNSQFYASDNNLLKVYSILNILLSILENTISGSESICNSINGQIKGFTIQDGSKTYIEP